MTENSILLMHVYKNGEILNYNFPESHKHLMSFLIFIWVPNSVYTINNNLNKPELIPTFDQGVHDLHI